MQVAVVSSTTAVVVVVVVEVVVVVIVILILVVVVVVIVVLTVEALKSVSVARILKMFSLAAPNYSFHVDIFEVNNIQLSDFTSVHKISRNDWVM